MASIEIDINRLSQLITSIDDIGNRANNWSRELRRTIGLVVQADVDQRFSTAPGVRQTGTVYGGAQWERLSEAYLRSNPRREGGQQLRDTGELAQSFLVSRKGNVLQSDGDSITFGSSLPKARYNQARRRMLFVHAALVEQVAATIELYISEGVR